MNVVALVLLVASIVFGAFGVVFVIETVKQQRNKKRPAAYSVGSFFAAAVLGLAAMYASTNQGFRISTAPSENVRVGDATMTAMISGAGTVA